MVNFRVLLVYPNLQLITLLPNNISILSGCLKSAGIDVKIFNTTFYRIEEKSFEEKRVEYMQIRPFNLKEKGIDYKETDIYTDFIKTIENYRPNLIGVTATEETYDLGINLVSRVRAKGIHTIFGGVHPTFSPEEVISNPNVDSVCVGEGEEALLELCMKMQAGEDIKGIKNIWVKLNGKVYKNGIRPLININNLPYEDYSVFEEKMFFRAMQGKVYRMIPITISRGCPFTCTFCGAPFLKKIYLQEHQGGYFRIKTVKRIIDELKYHIDRYKADYIYFNSETFFAKDQEEIRQFAKEYSAKINLPFWCQTRVETITEERVKMLEDMNCERINIGIEHGNEEFRRKILKKYFTNEQVIAAFKIFSKSRIPITVNNMLGFPDETRELVFDTIMLNRRIKADAINAFVFVPYKGTSLRQYCIEKGYLNPNAKTDTDIGNSILNMPQFPREQIKGLERTFPLYVKMPETYFDRIELAEQLNEEGDAMFAELREVYFRDYFK